jgi:hypothetical protein
MILQDLDKVEETFKKSIEVAEKSKSLLFKDLDQTQTVFMWQNNLLKFYMENDVERAIDYSKELIDECSDILPEKDQTDLKFSLATSIIL